MRNADIEFNQELESRKYVCPVCQKSFTIPLYVSKSGYVYKILVYDKSTKRNVQRKCCSYSCYRKGTQQSSSDYDV